MQHISTIEESPKHPMSVVNIRKNQIESNQDCSNKDHGRGCSDFRVFKQIVQVISSAHDRFAVSDFHFVLLIKYITYQLNTS